MCLKLYFQEISLNRINIKIIVVSILMKNWLQFDQTTRSIRVFDKYNNKTHSVYTWKQLFVFFRRFDRFRFASSTSTLFSYTRSRRRPSSFCGMHFRQIRPGNDFSRLRSFALPRRRMRPPPARKISPRPGVNRVCPPRLRRLSGTRGGRFSSSFEALPDLRRFAASCF